MMSEMESPNFHDCGGIEVETAENRAAPTLVDLQAENEDLRRRSRSARLR